ncbi:MAG: hypothetical protein ACFFAN_08795 [Promethearchaeota archaeon]
MEKLQIIKNSPNYDELVEFYKKEKKTKLKVRYHALVLMHEFKSVKLLYLKNLYPSDIQKSLIGY